MGKGGCSEDRDFGSVNVIVGSKHLYYTRDNLRTTRYFELSQSNLNLKKLNISLATDRIYYAQMGVVVNCELTKSAIYEWRLKTFNAIISAYEEAKAAYEEKMAEQEALGVQIKDSNPLFYRDIENTILRKNCISYLEDTQNDYGKDFYNLKANTGLFEQLKKYMPEYTRAEPKYFNGWNRKVVVVCNKLDNTNSIIKELKTKELPL